MDSLQAHPYDKSKCHPSALAQKKYAVSKLEVTKACFNREVLLIKRHSFLYIFRTFQVFFLLDTVFIYTYSLIFFFPYFKI